MRDPAPIAGGHYSHDLLLHERDQDLVDATRAFVDRGLSSGGQVLVHSSEERVAMLREAVGSHPRLDYGLDTDLYRSPSSTLFAYARRLDAEPNEMWVTGTVPFGDDPAGHAAWTRYESLVNAVLAPYAFHALCTYDTRSLPASTVAAARAAHPGLSAGGARSVSCADYPDPAAFLAHPLAGVPVAPQAPPSVAVTLSHLVDLRRVRHLLACAAETADAVSRDTVEGFVTASHEVLVNALEHGRPPVEVVMWVDGSRLVCRITDAGPGIGDILSGWRRCDASGPAGLAVARRLCEDVVLSNTADGGCSVLLATS
jgi:anti-sigma regulatory factor (Ser/Thr protein kinase)